MPDATEIPGLAGLTERQIEILVAIGEGLTVTQVGERFGLSTKTVSTHRARILNKLVAAGAIAAGTTNALIRYALIHKLVQ